MHRAPSFQRNKSIDFVRRLGAGFYLEARRVLFCKPITWAGRGQLLEAEGLQMHPLNPHHRFLEKLVSYQTGFSFAHKTTDLCRWTDSGLDLYLTEF